MEWSACSERTCSSLASYNLMSVSEFLPAVHFVLSRERELTAQPLRLNERECNFVAARIALPRSRALHVLSHGSEREFLLLLLEESKLRYGSLLILHCGCKRERDNSTVAVVRSVVNTSRVLLSTTISQSSQCARVNTTYFFPAYRVLKSAL